jgi:hypothetical protein
MNVGVLEQSRARKVRSYILVPTTPAAISCMGLGSTVSCRHWLPTVHWACNEKQREARDGRVTTHRAIITVVSSRWQSACQDELRSIRDH